MGRAYGIWSGLMKLLSLISMAGLPRLLATASMSRSRANVPSYLPGARYVPAGVLFVSRTCPRTR